MWKLGVPPNYSRNLYSSGYRLFFIDRLDLIFVKKVIDVLSEKIAKEKGLEEHAGKKIVQYDGLLKHIAKHEKEYISIESCECTINNIPTIIKNPEYVYYNEEKNGLEFYKSLMEKVCVVVQIVNKRELYVASVYPARDTKISNRKYKESYDKYVLTEEELEKRKEEQLKVTN